MDSSNEENKSKLAQQVMVKFNEGNRPKHRIPLGLMVGRFPFAAFRTGQLISVWHLMSQVKILYQNWRTDGTIRSY